MAQNWGKPPPSPFPLIIFFVLSHGANIQMSLSWDSQVGVPKFPKIGIPMTLETHNFVCKPPIEVSSKAKF